MSLIVTGCMLTYIQDNGYKTLEMSSVNRVSDTHIDGCMISFQNNIQFNHLENKLYHILVKSLAVSWTSFEYLLSHQ